MDSYFKSLLDGIEDIGLTDCVNIILLADHGFATSGEQRVMNLYDYDPDIRDHGFVEYGPVTMIYSYEEGFKISTQKSLNILHFFQIFRIHGRNEK